MPYPSKRNYLNEVKVNNASGFSGTIDSTKVYTVDGYIDLGDSFIDVPEGGITIIGLGSNISNITANSNIFGGTGAYSGRIKLIDISLTSPNVFDNNGTGAPSGGSEVSCIDVDFVDCASLGNLTGYRQGLWTGVGVIFCGEGLTMSGAWSGGFASLSSIVVGGLPNGPLFKAGVGLTIGGSFRSNMNAVSLGAGGVFCDFAPANILTDAGFSMEDVRTGNLALDPFPNMPPSSTKASFQGCKGAGVEDTYAGGAFVTTADGTTTVAAVDTLYQITATGVGQNLDWTAISNTNAIEYLSTQPISVSVNGSLSFSGGNNDQLGLQIRQWDDSAGQYVNVGPEYTATMNGGLIGTRAENLSFGGTAKLNQNDRIEVWIKNKSGTTDIITLAGGEFTVTER